jgi:hypothetical protein
MQLPSHRRDRRQRRHRRGRPPERQQRGRPPERPQRGRPPRHRKVMGTRCSPRLPRQRRVPKGAPQMFECKPSGFVPFCFSGEGCFPKFWVQDKQFALAERSRTGPSSAKAHSHGRDSPQF